MDYSKKTKEQLLRLLAERGIIGKASIFVGKTLHWTGTEWAGKIDNNRFSKKVAIFYLEKGSI